MPLAYPRSEEQLYYPGQTGDNGGTTAGIIAGNTDRTVDQFNRYSEENAQNIRQGMANIGKGIGNAVQGYREGRHDANDYRAADQRYALGQQEQQQNAGNLEEQGMRLKTMHNHQDYLQGTEEGHTAPRWQDLEDTSYKHDTEFVPKMDQASLAAQNASTAASNASTKYNQWSLRDAQQMRSRGDAAEQLAPIVAQKDQLEQAMRSGPPDEQTSSQLQAVNSKLEQLRSYWAQQGLDAQHIAGAEQVARMAVMHGQQASDVNYLLTPEGHNANMMADEVETKTHALQQAQQYADQFKGARSGTTEEAQAYQNLIGALHQLGPEGQTAAAHIREGEGAAFGASVDTSGFHSTSGRIDNAMAQLQNAVQAQHQALVQQYGQAPSNGFRGRVQRISGSVQKLGAGGTPDLFSGGTGGISPSAQDQQFVRGNRNGPPPIQQPSAPQNAAAGYGQHQAPVWERRRAEQDEQKTRHAAQPVHHEPGASPFRPRGQ